MALAMMKRTGGDDLHRDDIMPPVKKTMKPLTPILEDPVAALANARHEFGEHGGVNMSIEASTTFTVMEPETMRRMFSGELGPERDFFIYSRHFNPTVLNLGRQMAALEGTEAAYCTASGMSAISFVLMQLCSSGDHVVASQTLYGGTHALLTHFFPRACNITTSFVDLRDHDTVKAAIVEGRTKVLYFESVSNPTLTVADVPELCRIAHEKGVTVVVDNTFAPMVLSPARLGADVVVHSISKYISGGADVIADPCPFSLSSEIFSTMALAMKRAGGDDLDRDDVMPPAKKTMKPLTPMWVDPVAALANARHEFGEHGGVNMSIEASATFTVMEPETMRRLFSGELGPDRDFFIYSRHFNPTVLNLGRQMAALEGTEAAYCTASGMSAISSVLMQLCSSGDHVVASQTLYGGTHALLTHFFPRACNITTSFVDLRDHDKVKAAIVEGRTKVLYFEAVSNPTLTVADVPELCRIAHDKGLTVVVDNTFAPMVLSPARLGADVVVHSISKYISGGADVIAVSSWLLANHSVASGEKAEFSVMGSYCACVSICAVCGPASLVNSMMDLHQGALMLLGPTMNAKVAFELSERIPHLGLRMKEHCHRALVYATRMKKLGLKVIYPGLEDHPDHTLLKSLANKDYGYGGILCVDMETEERANRLMSLLQNCTQFGFMAVSLGYHETLMSCSGSSTSSEMNAEEKALAGISPGLVRMSIGYSGTLEQRWNQLEKALSRLQDSNLLQKN
ncbi:hypothetical protein RJ640_019143 [Escallonia rubra]|uniref:Methionine gamma-lyase n=1 Tax=Escallonia rubra TaxID=112253 RepID=A0AA88R9I3_9ASTE|nr:hypothetical protein RJ640_019143 [Escallonia rubra]